MGTIRSKGIILYDYLLVRGGAEQVSLSMAKALEAPLCVGSCNQNVFTKQQLQDIDLINLQARMPAYLARFSALQIFARKTDFLNTYDWVIYGGYYAPLAVHNHHQGGNIFYCHTIPRFAYDLKDWYLQQCTLWQRPLLKALIAYIRPRFEQALQKMDTVIANSENVRRRIKTYFGIDAQVIHPPCSTEPFQWLSQGDYYLSLARLESYKRVDRVITAFKKMPDKKLIVASGGSQLDHLQRIAAGSDNIHFTGWLSSAHLQELMGNAIASIYLPIEEDFGMSPVESMAAGKPVIGVAEGGLLETLVDGETGILIKEDPSSEHIMAAVQQMTPAVALAMRSHCQQRAMLFNPAIFFSKIRNAIASCPNLR